MVIIMNQFDVVSKVKASPEVNVASRQCSAAFSLAEAGAADYR